MLTYNYTVQGLKLMGPAIEIPSGQCNTIKLKFDIDNEYKDLRAYAFFIYDNNHYRTVLNDDKEVILPYRLTKEPGKFKLGFVAYQEDDNYLKQRVVTNTINCISYPALHSEEISPDEPVDIGVWEKFTLDIQNIQEELKKKADKKYYASLNRLEDFLYEIKYDNYDYKKGKEFFNNQYPIFGGACSAIRNGDWYGRNFDWYYDNAISFVIRTNKTPYRHETLGIASHPFITKKLIEQEGAITDDYDILPFYTLDAINDCGVFCNINVAPVKDNGKTIGTIPQIEERERLCGIMLPRYIVDNFSSAQEAVDYLNNYVSVYAVYRDEEPKKAEEFHYIIGDENDTFILEFVNNEMKFLKINENFNRPFITNFVVNGTNVNGNHIIIDESLKDHPNGIERYDIILEEYNNTNNYQGMRNLLEDLKYTNAYKCTNPYWYSEFYGETEYGDITIHTSSDILQQVMEYEQELFANRSRETVETWQTVSSSIYNIKTKTLCLRVQEQTDDYIFQLGDVDDVLSEYSENPVQNKVVTNEFLYQSRNMGMLASEIETLRSSLYQLEQRVKRLEEQQ